MEQAPRAVAGPAAAGSGRPSRRGQWPDQQPARPRPGARPPDDIGARIPANWQALL